MSGCEHYTGKEIIVDTSECPYCKDEEVLRGWD